MPVGPIILWPEKARKSASSAFTSTGMWGTDCAASTTHSAPTSWARFAISSTGLMVPRTLEVWTTVTSFVRRVMSSSYSSIRSRPCSSTSTHLMTTPRRSLRKYHGMVFEWCSMTVVTISSPSFMLPLRPQP